jgi:microcystin-dependent protein
LASTFTPNLALEIPAHGDYATTGWDNPMDGSLRTLDTAYGGLLSLTLSGGAHLLTLAEASNQVISLGGTLSSDQYLYFPNPGPSGKRVIVQGINLNGHTLYVRGNNGSDGNGIYFWTSFGIPYSIVVLPWRVMWDYGSINPSTVADIPVGWIGNGWLPCDGRWVSQALHDILYDVVGGTWGISGGSFKLPDYRGTVLAMADQVGTLPSSGPYAVNEGNRGILNSWGVTTFAGEANHQISIAEMPGHNHPGSGDSGHGHGASQDAHSHNVTGGQVIVGGYGPASGTSGVLTLANGTTDARQPNVYVGTGYANIYIGAQGGWAAHNNIQPTTCTIKMMRW